MRKKITKCPEKGGKSYPKLGASSRIIVYFPSDAIDEVNY